MFERRGAGDAFSLEIDVEFELDVTDVARAVAGSSQRSRLGDGLGPGQTGPVASLGRGGPGQSRHQDRAGPVQ